MYDAYQSQFSKLNQYILLLLLDCAWAGTKNWVPPSFNSQHCLHLHVLICVCVIFCRVVCQVAVWGAIVVLVVVVAKQMLSGDHLLLHQVVPLLPQLRAHQRELGADR